MKQDQQATATTRTQPSTTSAVEGPLHVLLAEGWLGRKKSMNKQWCRFCDKWHAPFNGHICAPEDLRRHVVALGNRADEAESVIDWLRTQAVADIAPGFVGIPQVE